MGVAEIGREGGDLIRLAQVRVDWPPAVDTVINIKVPQKAVTVPRTEAPSAFQECLLWVELISYNQRK